MKSLGGYIWPSITCLVLMISLILNIKLGQIAAKYYKKYKIAATFTEQLSYKTIAKLSVESNKRNLIIFGDSRIAQWVELPKLESYFIVNQGWGGATTMQLRAQLENSVMVLKPDTVILQMGINDLTTIGVANEYKDKIVENCLDNIEYIVRKLRSAKIRVVLIHVIPPESPDLLRRFFWNDSIVEAVKQVNLGLLKLSQDTQSEFVELITTNMPNHEVKKLYADTLHLNINGYRLLNQKIEKVLSD